MYAPEPQVKEIDICMFVNSDYTGDNVSSRSSSGFLIYMNTALVQWFSKKQSTEETSFFGAKFFAMKQCIDSLRSLSYQLTMKCIPTSSPLYI